MVDTPTATQTEAQVGHDSVASLVDPRGARRGDLWRRFRRNRLALVGVAALALIALGAVFAPVVTRYDPTIIDPTASRLPPSGAHWFGTDLLGRDLFTRVVYGARVSLRVGVAATALASALGLVAGALAGWYGGKLDTVLMRGTDVFLAFPYILAAIVIISVIGRGERTVILVLGGLGWMSIARIFRSSILQIKETEYVDAARAMGSSGRHIILRHLLPNAVQPVIVVSTIFIGTFILSEAALSFLGVGITEPTPAWGLMVADGRRFLFSSPHLLFFPGMAIFVTVVSFVFVGDGLRDALDPRLR